MAKVSVPQFDGEILILPGGIQPQRTYRVAKGIVNVPDDELREFLVNIDGSKALSGPPEIKAAEDAAAAEEAAARAAEAAEEARQREVAEASAAGAARALKQK